jgi:stage V sporulation protein B
MALSISLIPEISKNKGNKQKLKRIYHKVMLFSFLLGLISNLVIYIFAKDILMIVFHTGLGLKYIKFLAFFFVLFYFEGPLASILQALDEAKYSMKTTTIGIIIKLVVMTLLCFTHIGIYSLIISEIVNIIIVNYLNNKKVLKLLK